MKQFRFEDPYDHINPMENRNYETHLIDAHYDHKIYDAE